MKKTTKCISLVLASVLTGMPLTGCGGDNVKTVSGREKITIWTYNSHNKEIMQRLVREYNDGAAKDLGVELEYIVKSSEEYAQALEMAMTAGTTPDFFLSQKTQTEVENGVIYAISDLPGGQEWVDSYNMDAGTAYMFTNRFDGKVYKLPFGSIANGLIYNKDMFKKYGIVDENGEPTPPKSFDEMREYAKIMTQNGDYGFILPVKSGVFANYVQNIALASYGVAPFNHATGEYDYAGYADVMKLLLDMKHDGSIYPGADGLDNDPARAIFAEGGVGMFLAGHYDTAVFTSQFPAKCEWDVAPYPVKDPEHRFYQGTGYNSGFSVSADAVERVGADKIIEVMKWLYGKEVISETYKTGNDLPAFAKDVEGVELDEGVHPSWKHFMEIQSEWSKPSFWALGTDLEGTPTITDILPEIWAEEADADEALLDLTKRSNDGIAKKMAADPTLKMENYVFEGYTRAMEN